MQDKMKSSEFIELMTQHIGTGYDKEIKLEDKIIDLNLNSISFIKLIVKIEKELGIQFNDEDLNYQKFSTVNDVFNYVLEKKAKI